MKRLILLFFVLGLLLFSQTALAADLSKPPVVPELQALTIEKLEAEQRANDNQLQSFQLQLALINRAANDVKADNLAKRAAEQKVSDEAFKTAGLSDKEWKIDLAKREFVKIETPKPAEKK